MASSGEVRLEKLARNSRLLGNLVIIVTAAEMEITTALNEHMPFSILGIIVGVLAVVFCIAILFLVVNLISYFALRKKTSFMTEAA